MSMIKIYHAGGTEIYWECTVCGNRYYAAGNGEFRFCPACQERKHGLEKEYWDNKAAGMRSVASDIVSRVLAGK